MIYSSKLCLRNCDNQVFWYFITQSALIFVTSSSPFDLSHHSTFIQLHRHFVLKFEVWFKVSSLSTWLNSSEGETHWLCQYVKWRTFLSEVQVLSAYGPGESRSKVTLLKSTWAGVTGRDEGIGSADSCATFCVKAAGISPASISSHHCWYWHVDRKKRKRWSLQFHIC